MVIHIFLVEKTDGLKPEKSGTFQYTLAMEMPSKNVELYRLYELSDFLRWM